MIGARGDLAALVIGIQLLNGIPAILYIIIGFGIRNLKKWSIVLTVIALIMLLLRTGNNIRVGTFAISNLYEPIMLLVVLLVAYINRKQLV